MSGKCMSRTGTLQIPPQISEHLHANSEYGFLPTIALSHDEQGAG